MSEIILRSHLDNYFKMLTTDVVAQTKDWIECFVIGLNICPFAGLPFKKNLIRYSVIEASQLDTVMGQIEEEIKLLCHSDRNVIETSLLILPNINLPFLSFNDFNGLVLDLIEDLQLEDELQAVGFHSEFQYADSLSHDLSNYTNRSPYPMIHLLREVSVAQVADEATGMDISNRNMELLRGMNKSTILEILNSKSAG